MEAERRWRFVIPPAVLFASISWGATIDPVNKGRELFTALRAEDRIVPLVIGAFAGGVLVVAIGYILSTVTISVLSLIWRRQHGGYEAGVGSVAEHAIWNVLFGSAGTKMSSQSETVFNALVVYDHWLIPKDLHAWIQRRWQSIMLASNTATAVIVAPVVGIALDIRPTWPWVVASAAVAFLLMVSAARARRQTFNLILFLALNNVATIPNVSGGTVIKAAG
jgi:hypothetical protein